MTWLEGNSRNPRPAGDRIRDLLARPDILRVPGAHNAMAGLIAKEQGFAALYISGGGVTTTMGLPDLGIMTLEELCFIVRMVARSTDLPLIVDGDVGYGGTLNTMRTVQELEMAGAGAVHIEDQLLPKKCGHLNDKRLVSIDEAASKIAAAKKASTHLVIIARTDAASVEGLDGAIKRARAYKEAGADVVFPDGLPTKEEFCRFAGAVPGPRMANMTEFGRTPHFTARQFQDFGYDIVIWPATSMRVAAYAMRELYIHIKVEDGTEDFEDRMLTRAESYALIGYHDVESLDVSVAKSLIPQTTGDTKKVV
ncbi:MAG: methylisocitrate lyase [Rhodospirillaceae bacterium TMED8]|nr:methylisocitrate lyase [Magnetovibrio sp.]OUT52267.1 MAG: methylisocitrate lyase [Rhodospirillaceae bacterium TMED8]